MTPASIYQSLKEHAGAEPARPIVEFYDLQISRQQLVEQIDQYRSVLAQDWAGQQVAILLPTDPSTLALYVALLSIGCNAQVMNVDWPQSIIQQTIWSVKSALVICENEPLPEFQDTEVLTIEELDEIGKTSKVQELIDPSSARYTCFTSGSTGSPKGCVRTERSWVNSFNAEKSISHLSSEDTVMIIGNFSHSLFLYAAAHALFVGAGIVIFSSFHPLRIWNKIHSARSAVIYAVPTQIDALVAAAKAGSSTVRCILSTGSKLSEALVARVPGVFKNTEIIEFYGTSELSYVTSRIPDKSHKETFVGWPVTGVEISILDPQGQPCDLNISGYVHIESLMKFEGYMRDRILLPFRGSFTAGDIGYLDQSGGLHLVGRGDRMFQSSGHNIIPEEIERALLSIEGIDQAAVIGRPDDRRGKKIVSIICLSDRLSRRDIIGCLRNLLPQYAIPTLFLICNKWPTTVSCKTDYEVLKGFVSKDTLEYLR